MHPSSWVLCVETEFMFDQKNIFKRQQVLDVHSICLSGSSVWSFPRNGLCVSHCRKMSMDKVKPNGLTNGPWTRGGGGGWRGCCFRSNLCGYCGMVCELQPALYPCQGGEGSDQRARINEALDCLAGLPRVTASSSFAIRG